MKTNQKEMFETYYNFIADINDILTKNKVMINSKETELESWECVFDIFFYRKIWGYEQTESNRCGIVLAFNENYKKKLGMIDIDFADSIINKVNLFFNKFYIPTYNDSKDNIIQEIISSENNNCYKVLLYSFFLNSLYEKGNLDCIDERYLNSICVSYDFDVMLARENKQVSSERNRIEKDIPDFSNVSCGQKWYGRNRKADFIRALKLQPKPAGKNSRIAQEKSILRSCYFLDDTDKQILTLIETYPKRLPKTRKERKKNMNLILKWVFCDIY